MAKELPIGKIIMIFFIAILSIYLFGQLMPKDKPHKCTADDVKDEAYECVNIGDTATIRQFKVPATVDPILLSLFKYIVVALSVYLAYMIIMKTTSGPMNKGHFLTLVIIGIAVYLLAKYILKPILMENDLISNIAFDWGSKLGVLKP